MSKLAIGALCTLGFIIIIGGMSALGLLGLYNGAVRHEADIKAQYTQNINNLSQYSNKIGEMVQVPSMYRDDFAKVLTEAMQGRYGKDGSQAAFQWLQEHQINFDSSIYKTVQNEIAAGRDRFEVDQKLLIDKKRVYETRLNTMPGGFFLSFMGFPKIDLTKYDIVKSDYANKAFETKVENGMKLR